MCHSGILDPFCSFRGLGIIPVILSSFRPASRSCRIVHEAAGRRGSVAPWWQAMAGVHHHPVIWRRGPYRHRLWSQGVDQNGQNGSGCCCNGEMEVSSGCSWKSWEPPCGGGQVGLKRAPTLTGRGTARHGRTNHPPHQSQPSFSSVDPHLSTHPPTTHPTTLQALCALRCELPSQPLRPVLRLQQRPRAKGRLPPTPHGPDQL